MKNKELTKGLCISLASAIVACSPLSILASEEATAAETSSEQESPASEPVVPDTPAPEPVVPDTPTPEPVVPDTPTPQPTQPAEPETPTPTPEPSSGEEGEEENTDPEDPGHGEDPGEDPGENTDPEDPGEDPGENTDPENPEDPEDLTEEEKAAAEAVVSQIEALAKKKLTIKDKDAVAAVRSSYDALSDKAKALVTNFDKLTLIENQMEELVKEEELLAKVGDPVYYKDTASIHHAGKEFYLKNLKEIYHLSFSDDIEKVLDEIVKEYLEENGISTEGLADNVLFRVYNWQDILAVYVYQQSLDGKDTYVLDKDAKDALKEIFAEMNALVHDPKDENRIAFSNDHIEDYIEKNKISAKDQQILKKYLETDCKLLCATVTAYPGFVRESVGEGVSEERVQVIAAAYSAIGKVGYFWGGKYPQVGENPAWGTFMRVEAEGSRTTGMLRAYGLDCSGFVSWAVVNGYESSSMQNAIGEGTSEQWEKAGAVRIEDVQPGDLVFHDGPAAGSQNHVGIVVGKTDSGDLVVVHCSSGQNGVTVGDAYGAGFRYVRQASFYPSKEETEKEFVDISRWVSEESDTDTDITDHTDPVETETEETAGSEQTKEAEEAAGSEQTTEAEETAGSEQTTEAEETAGSEQTTEAEETAESEQTTEAEETAESEQTTEAEETAESEQTTEAEETAGSEQTTETEDAFAETTELPEEVLAKLQMFSQPMDALEFSVPEEIGDSDFLVKEAQAIVAETTEDVKRTDQDDRAVSKQQDPDIQDDTELTDPDIISDVSDTRDALLEEQEDYQEESKSGLPVVKVQEEEAQEESFDGDGELPQDILEKLLLLNQSDLLKENLLDASTASSLNQLQKFNESDLKD